MKKLLLFAAVILSGFAYGQTSSYGNFKLVEQDLIYQKVFTQDSITIAALEKYYKPLPYVANLTTTAEGLQFDMKDLVVDYKKFQYNQNVTPLIMQTGKFSGKVTVGVKDGRYRVTVSNIQFMGAFGNKNITANENLVNYAAKNSGTLLSPDWLKPTWLGLLDQAFTDKLTYKKVKDDW